MIGLGKFKNGREENSCGVFYLIRHSVNDNAKSGGDGHGGFVDGFRNGNHYYQLTESAMFSLSHPLWDSHRFILHLNGYK